MADLGRIRKLCEIRGISQLELCRRMGKTPAWIHAVMARGSTTTDTIEKVSKILQVSPCVFFSPADINSFLLDEQKKSISTNTEDFDRLKKESDELKNQLLACRRDFIRMLEEKHGIVRDKQQKK